jgi:hypothetical protein
MPFSASTAAGLSKIVSTALPRWCSPFQSIATRSGSLGSTSTSTVEPAKTQLAFVTGTETFVTTV